MDENDLYEDVAKRIALSKPHAGRNIYGYFRDVRGACAFNNKALGKNTRNTGRYAKMFSMAEEISRKAII